MKLLPASPRARWVLALVGAWIVVGCTVQRPAAWVGLEANAPQVFPKPEPKLLGGPRIPHTVHADNDMACTDCHALDEKTGEPTMPKMEFCQDCHEDIDEDKPDDQKIRNLFFDKDGKPKWKRAIHRYSHELKWNHKAHAKIEGGCKTCHGNMKGTDGRPDAMLFDMAGCRSCHAKHGGPRECGACHKVMNRKTPPPTHQSGTWRLTHGHASRVLRTTATVFRCSLCHHEPDDCDNCHEVTKPRDHAHLWLKRHGLVVRANGATLPPRCAMCHKTREYCDRCHFDREPSNHTTLFRTRTHGMLAAMDRKLCATCHTTNFCQRCHEDTPPRSHRAGWAMGRVTHCVQCHFPISMETTCRVCHRSNPTHSTAPAQPAGHIPGRNCRVCHNALGGGLAPPLRHVDNGMNCEFCHH
jgi:hypothetical protein